MAYIEGETYRTKKATQPGGGLPKRGMIHQGGTPESNLLAPANNTNIPQYFGSTRKKDGKSKRTRCSAATLSLWASLHDELLYFKMSPVKHRATNVKQGEYDELEA